MRAPRKRCDSEIYHVISRGTGRQLIFEDDNDRATFLDFLAKLTTQTSVDVYAWCLMGNHVHLLLHAPLTQISTCMKSLCSQYAQYFNKRHARVGHLFQERFKSEPIEDEAYLLVVASYIHFNPQKAGIANQQDYPWSSYREYTGKANSHSICSCDVLLNLFGGKKGFIAFHNGHAGEDACMDVDTLRSATIAMPDERAIALAKGVLGGKKLSDLKSLPRAERNSCLEELRAAGLSIRQIERLTGISRGIIQNAGKHDK